MKTIKYITICFTFFSSIAFSNGGPPPPPPLYRAKNIGAVYQPPLIVGKSQSTLFAQVSYVAISDVDGRIDLQGTNTDPKGIVDGKNFEWQTPTALFNFGISAAFSNYSSIIINLGLNKTEDLKLTGLEICYNAVITRSENHFLRLGFGINFHPRDFVWYTSATSQPKNDGGVDYDPFITLAYNSGFDDWLFNPFVQFSYSTQTLLDTDKETYSSEVYKNVNVFTATPGLTYNWGNDKLLSLGVTFTSVGGIENSKNFVLTPSIQFSYYW